MSGVNSTTEAGDLWDAIRQARDALSMAAFRHPSASDDVGVRCSTAEKRLDALLAQSRQPSPAQAEPNWENPPAAIDGRLEVWLTSGSDDLNPHTKNLVVRFARAMAKKLLAAEKKYGYTDGWRTEDWMDECRAKLLEHIAKGDPVDVANYCAFLWFHGASTATGAAEGAEPTADAERLKKLEAIVSGIGKANRFDPEIFNSDSAFVDWAQSLCAGAMPAKGAA